MAAGLLCSCRTGAPDLWATSGGDPRSGRPNGPSGVINVTLKGKNAAQLSGGRSSVPLDYFSLSFPLDQSL